MIKLFENFINEIDPYNEERQEEPIPAEILKKGDKVSYIGWRDDLLGKEGVVIKCDDNDHALVLFDNGDHFWYPFNHFTLI